MFCGTDIRLGRRWCDVYVDIERAECVGEDATGRSQRVRSVKCGELAIGRGRYRDHRSPCGYRRIDGDHIERAVVLPDAELDGVVGRVTLSWRLEQRGRIARVACAV